MERCILVIAASDQMRMNICEVLELEGYRTLSSADFVGARAALHDQRYDLIMAPPADDSGELLMAFLGSLADPPPAVVYVYRWHAIHSQVSPHLIAPFSPQDLLDAVAARLEKGD